MVEAVKKIELTEEEKLLKKEEKKAQAAIEKAAKEAKKAERLASRQQSASAKNAEFVKDPNDPSADKFGDRELNMSQGNPEDRFTKVYVDLKNLGDEHVGKTVLIRARVQNSRASGKNLCFMVLRQAYATVQAVLSKSDLVSPGMVQYSAKIPKESIIEILASVTKPDSGVAGCSQ